MPGTQQLLRGGHGPDGFTGETFKDIIIPMLLRVLQKIEEGENPLYAAIIMLMGNKTKKAFKKVDTLTKYLEVKCSNA